MKVDEDSDAPVAGSACDSSHIRLRLVVSEESSYHRSLSFCTGAVAAAVAWLKDPRRDSPALIVGASGPFRIRIWSG